jgi:hypothetical protein
MADSYQWKTPPAVRGVRRTAVAALVAAACWSALTACSSSPSEASTLTGTWDGTYICSQGETGLKLTVNATSDGKLTATFNFFAVPSNPGVPTGDYTMTGSYSANAENFTMGHWTKQPTGYEMVNLSAGPPSNGGTVLSGKVSTAGCSTFTVKKA